MGIKYVKRCPILVAIREMHMETVIRPTLQPSAWQKLESWIKPSVGKQEFSCISPGNVKEQSLQSNMTVLSNKQWMQIVEYSRAVRGNNIAPM